MDEIAAFVESYASAVGEGRVRFAWNGRHPGAGFADANHDFRGAVIAAVLANLGAVPLELVRDLFRAEARYSREAWGIGDGAGELAQELLQRGGTVYLDDYLDGKFQSFDAHLGSGFECEAPLAQSLLAEAQRRLQAAPDSPNAELWRQGGEYFAR